MRDKIEGYSTAGATSYHYGRFPPKHLDYELIHGPLSTASAAIARYDATLNSLHNKELLLAPLQGQEAVISSRLEGTIATLDEVLRYEAEGEDEGERIRYSARAEVLEVWAYKRALEYAQKMMWEGLPICGRLIRETHGRMLFLGRGANKQPGHFKSEQNFVVDKSKRKILFIPIDPLSLDEAFLNLENYMNDETIDPLLQTAIAHVEFEAIHPFKDGNGRIGRMLIPLSLWSKKIISVPHFYVSGHLETQRDDYIDRLRDVSANDRWTEWCTFFLSALEQIANDNLDTAHRIGDLYEEMKEVFPAILGSQWSIRALDYVFEQPVFKNSAFTRRSGIPNQTAARLTKKLADEGILETVIPAAGRRSAMYAFEPLLEIVRT